MTRCTNVMPDDGNRWQAAYNQSRDRHSIKVVWTTNGFVCCLFERTWQSRNSFGREFAACSWPGWSFSGSRSRVLKPPPICFLLSIYSLFAVYVKMETIMTLWLLWSCVVLTKNSLLPVVEQTIMSEMQWLECGYILDWKSIRVQFQVYFGS